MSGNNTQRVYDAMAESREPLKADQLVTLTRMDANSIRKALEQLVFAETAYRTGARNSQRYGVVPGAARPIDGRTSRWSKANA